jgi:hypothetical protein
MWARAGAKGTASASSLAQLPGVRCSRPRGPRTGPWLAPTDWLGRSSCGQHSTVRGRSPMDSRGPQWCSAAWRRDSWRRSGLGSDASSSLGPKAWKVASIWPEPPCSEPMQTWSPSLGPPGSGLFQGGLSRGRVELHLPTDGVPAKVFSERLGHLDRGPIGPLLPRPRKELRP